MIDTFVKLVEKLTELVKYRKEIKDKSFNVLVTQIFENIQIIHTDYLKMFESCERAFKEGKKLKTIAEILSKDRIEQEALRRSVLGFIGIYKHDKRTGEYQEFFETAHLYFRWPDRIQLPSHSSASTSLLTEINELAYREQFLNEGSAQKKRTALLDCTSEHLRVLRTRWKQLSEVYATLVIENVRP